MSDVTIRKLGSSLTIDLGDVHPDYKGVVLTVRHMGPGKVREWQVALKKLQNTETARIIELRRKYSAEEWSELYAEGFATPESSEDATAFARRVLQDCAISLVGNGVVDDQASAAGTTEYLLAAGLGEGALPHLLSAQLPTKRALFGQGPGRDQPAGSAPAVQ